MDPPTAPLPHAHPLGACDYDSDPHTKADHFRVCSRAGSFPWRIHRWETPTPSSLAGSPAVPPPRPLSPVPMAVSPPPSALADQSEASPAPHPPSPSVPVTPAASAPAPAGCTVPEVGNARKGSAPTDDGADELSVFDIQNIFRARWFLNKDQLIPTVASAQKDEKGHLSWVEFTPHFHTHLLQCARRVLPPRVPIAKVKCVMFVFLLEVLSGEVPQKDFFAPPHLHSSQQRAKATVRRTHTSGPDLLLPLRSSIPIGDKQRKLVAHALEISPPPPSTTILPTHVAEVWHSNMAPLWASPVPDSIFLHASGCPLPPRPKKTSQHRPLASYKYTKLKVLRCKAGTAERLTMTLGEQQELAALSARQFHYGRLEDIWDPKSLSTDCKLIVD